MMIIPCSHENSNQKSNINLNAKCVHAKLPLYTQSLKKIQQKWANFMVADALAPRIASSSVDIFMSFIFYD